MIYTQAGGEDAGAGRAGVPKSQSDAGDAAGPVDEVERMLTLLVHELHFHNREQTAINLRLRQRVDDEKERLNTVQAKVRRLSTDVELVLEQADHGYAPRAVQFHPHGSQSDFVWLSARTPHGAYVW